MWEHPRQVNFADSVGKTIVGVVDSIRGIVQLIVFLDRTFTVFGISDEEIEDPLLKDIWFDYKNFPRELVDKHGLMTEDDLRREDDEKCRKVWNDRNRAARKEEEERVEYERLKEKYGENQNEI